jgi:gliding motility-associated-like protein
VGLNPGAQDVTINLIGINGNSNLQFGVVPTYTWLNPYKGQTSILTPSNSAGITVNAPLKLPSVVVYTLISGYNGVPGCKRIDTVNIRVVDCRPVRNVKFTTTEVNDTICARSCITFQNLTDTMAGGPQKLLWTFEGGSPRTSTATIPTVCYNLPGRPYNVILQVSNPYPISTGGSTLTMGVLGYVKVVDIPNVTIIPPGQSRSDTTVRFGQSVKLVGKGAVTYEWAPNYNITSLTNPSVTVSPFKSTQYILTGYNSKACWSSDTLNVIVVADCGEMYVPNAFSPNHDGANDVLFVRGICLESMTFMIFNRWGEKIFETNDQKVGWDGTYKGEDMNTGVFVFRLEGKTYDGKGFSIKGNITLIR